MLQLVGRGVVDLDASIWDYVDLAGTTISRGVTLRHLLTHTSGLADDADDEVEYGFGLEFAGPDWWKDGCWDGASGIVKHYGDHGIDAVVLSNSRDGAWTVVRELDCAYR